MQLLLTIWASLLLWEIIIWGIIAYQYTDAKAFEDDLKSWDKEHKDAFECMVIVPFGIWCFTSFIIAVCWIYDIIGSILS